MPRVLFAGRRSVSLAADASGFTVGTPPGTVLARLSNPFVGATSYAVVGTMPAQLALSGDRIVAGNAAATAGASYALKIRATSADGTREMGETIRLDALASAAAPPPPAPALLPLGSRLVAAGDSKVSGSSSPYMRNWVLATLDRLAGRVRLGIAGDQGIGGNTIAQLQARLVNVTAQAADVTLIAIGHNTMSATAASVIQQVQDLHAATRSAVGAGKLILWTTVLPSQSSDGGLHPVDGAKLVAVNDAIMALNGRDAGATRAVNLTYRASDNGGAVFTPATMCYAEANGALTQYIHPNDVGAQFVAGLVAAAIDDLVAPQSYAQALADTGAAREHGANLDTKYALPGVAGARAGSGAANVSGEIADNYTLTNASGATVVCSKIDNGDGTWRQRIVITGTGLAEGHVEFKATNSAQGGRVVTNQGIGDVVETLIGYRIAAADGTSPPQGVRQWGVILPTSDPTFGMGRYNAVESNIAGTAPVATGLRVARAPGRMQQVALSFLLPSFGIRFAGTVSVLVDLERPITRKTDLVAYAAPIYVGSDGIKGASERTGPNTGAATIAAGATVTLQPGVFAGGAVTPTGVVETSTDGGATWTTALATMPANWQWSASGLSAGTKVRLSVTATNALDTAVSTWTGTIV